MYIDSGNVYYRNHLWNGEVQIGTTEKYNIEWEARTLPLINMDITGGGYTAETTGIATANGALDAGLMHITYQVHVDDTD